MILLPDICARALHDCLFGVGLKGLNKIKETFHGICATVNQRGLNLRRT